MIMGSSLSKARDAGDERVSQRQRGLDTAVDTVVGTASDTVVDTVETAAVQELVLHPAAAIFRNETLAGIGDENAALENNNSRFRHLPDFSQKLDIAFSTASSEFREGVRFITYHQNICVQTQLSHGSVVLVDGNERLVIPVNDANAHPIDDCGTIGNISSYLAGLQIGSFPLVRFYNVQNVVKIRIEDDGSIHFTLYLSPLISIEGRLDAAISNDALAAYFEREELINTMKLPIPLAHLHSTQEKGITFTLTSISVSLTSRVKKSLSYFSEASSPSDSDEVDKLRSIVVDALGESEHKEVLNKNLELKCESAALAGIRRMILGVDVSHSAGAFSVTLDEGEELKDSDLDKWIIELNGRDDISLSVPIADMGSIGISFSGMQLRMEVSETMLYARRAAEAMPIFFNDRIGRRISVILVGVFNWVDFSDDEISDIADDFGGKLRSVLEGNGEDVFPARMTFRMTHMFCPPMAEDLLKKVGPLKESDSNADE
mmetsp:Transcript_16062/g.25007  ORF Transcript_16062/g.25007 Transcript_16062/m.25007 type:complete len:490 (+) Transcript_16062:108-1577(+)